MFWEHYHGERRMSKCFYNLGEAVCPVDRLNSMIETMRELKSALVVDVSIQTS